MLPLPTRAGDDPAAAAGVSVPGLREGAVRPLAESMAARGSDVRWSLPLAPGELPRIDPGRCTGSIFTPPHIRRAYSVFHIDMDDSDATGPHSIPIQGGTDWTPVPRSVLCNLNLDVS